MQHISPLKEAGAMNNLLQLNVVEKTEGITISAGKHAKAITYHRWRLDMPATIFLRGKILLGN